MFWAGDENCQWTTMDHADCLWESSRSSDQLQRRRGGRTWTCCSVERRLDDVWRTVVDYERRHSRPACTAEVGQRKARETRPSPRPETWKPSQLATAFKANVNKLASRPRPKFNIIFWRVWSELTAKYHWKERSWLLILSPRKRPRK